MLDVTHCNDAFGGAFLPQFDHNFRASNRWEFSGASKKQISLILALWLCKCGSISYAICNCIMRKVILRCLWECFGYVYAFPKGHVDSQMGNISRIASLYSIGYWTRQRSPPKWTCLVVWARNFICINVVIIFYQSLFWLCSQLSQRQ